MKNNFNRFLALSWGSLAGTLCLLGTAQPAKALTFVLDFIEDGQGFDSLVPDEEVTFDVFGVAVSDFDITAYGFENNLTNFTTVTGAILDKVETHYSSVPLAEQLNINFEIGNIGTSPINGDTEYYYIQIGEYETEYDLSTTPLTLKTEENRIVKEPSPPDDLSSTLGIAAIQGARTSSGQSNPYNLSQSSINSFAIGSVFTDHISTSLNTLVDGGNDELNEIVNAISGTLSHEIGHTLSLEHVYKSLSLTETMDVPPLMGTGALDLNGADRIIDREFSSFAYAKDSTLAFADSDHIKVETVEGKIIEASIEASFDEFGNPFIQNALPEDFPNNLRTVNNVALLQDSVNGTSVPFEFSPSMGLFLVGGTWGIASVRKKSQQKNQLKK